MPKPPNLAALSLPVANVDPTLPAFRVRVVVQTTVPESWVDDGTPGWKPVRQAKDTGWISRTNPAAFRAATRHVLHWKRGAEAPVILQLDLSRTQLKGAQLIGSEHLPDVRLTAVDLVPLQPLDGRALGFGAARELPAYLSFLLEAAPGQGTLVRNVLELVGARRELWRFTLAPRGKPSPYTLAALLADATASIEQGAPFTPQLDAPPRRASSPGESWIVIAAHVPEEPWDFSTEEETEAALTNFTGAAMLLTAARPRAEYPKLSPRTRRFKLPESKDTLYAIHDLGMGALIGPSDDRFNQEQKPRIVLEAHYLQWLIARHLAHVPACKPAALVASFERENRRAFMREALQFALEG